MMNRTYTHEEMMKVMRVVCGIASANALTQFVDDDDQADEIIHKAIENTTRDAEVWIRIALDK
jgi:hypothetical protein